MLGKTFTENRKVCISGLKLTIGEGGAALARVIFIAFFKHYQGFSIVCQKVDKSASFWLVYVLFFVLYCLGSQNLDLLE